jgi:SpoVK/Ycf46/Vps4 family AAA+-type ATPase
MARHLAQSLRKKALEINTVDLNKRALKASDRLDCYRFCQAILARSSNALVIFDEVEEILSDGSFSEFGFKSEKGFTKGLLNTVLETNGNTVLETNGTPAIWITNTVRGVDPAYLRRFDIVVELTTPVERLKKKIAWRVFKDLPINERMVERMVRHRKVTPAHFEKVNRICQRIGVSTPEEAGLVASKILNGDLKAVHARPLEMTRPEQKRRIELPYRPNLINCDTDIHALTQNLDADASVRICSFGPPGTGKTAWARHLAESIGKPLLVKHAADVLDKFLGETEKNTAEIFREAEKTNSVLMLDEVDSFLPDRANASRHWEITQANQFLTAMESFEGILICATNLKDNLDPATMRRFDFKINFGYLETEQSALLACDLLEALGVKVTRSQESALCVAFRNLQLAHGDFAALLRRYSALKTKPDWRQLVEDLSTEVSFRQAPSQAIGFLAELH